MPTTSCFCRIDDSIFQCKKSDQAKAFPHHFISVTIVCAWCSHLACYNFFLYVHEFCCSVECKPVSTGSAGAPALCMALGSPHAAGRQELRLQACMVGDTDPPGELAEIPEGDRRRMLPQQKRCSRSKATSRTAGGGSRCSAASAAAVMRAQRGVRPFASRERFWNTCTAAWFTEVGPAWETAHQDGCGRAPAGCPPTTWA